MKKILITLLTLLTAVILAFALTSCGDTSDTTGSTTPEGTTTEAPVTKNPVLVTAFDKPEEYVTLPEFSQITASNEKVQTEVDKYMASILAEMSRDDFRDLPEGTQAEKGDCVNIHYTGRAKDPSVTLSAETLKGMTNADDKAGYDLILGSGRFIPGFEEQLIGATAGGKVSVDVTFPDNYSEELGGVAVIFEVTVNKVTRATVSKDNVVALSVLYTLKEGEATEKLTAFMAAHEIDIDLSATEEEFDEYFDFETVTAALIGAKLYSTVKMDLTVAAEDAKELGYESEITLSAEITVVQIVIYPKEMTDADINAYTGGQYPTVEAFTKYVTDHYKDTYAYDAVIEAATYGEIPKDVYDILYQQYYDSSIYNQIGDTSGMTAEELAAKLTDEVKKKAEDFAKENATAEYQDRMLVGYLANKLEYTLTEERYKTLLTDMYNYYLEVYYMQLYYMGITSVELFEDYFTEESLRFQFTIDEVVSRLGELVSWA